MQIFKHFSREHAPRPPWSRFCYFSCLKLNLPEKLSLKSHENWCPSQKKILNTPLTWKRFQKVYLLPFPGLNVFAFSQRSNWFKITSTPPKLCGSAPVYNAWSMWCHSQPPVFLLRFWWINWLDTYQYQRSCCIRTIFLVIGETVIWCSEIHNNLHF